MRPVGLRRPSNRPDVVGFDGKEGGSRTHPHRFSVEEYMASNVPRRTQAFASFGPRNES
jgi:hypothetical protein